MSCMKLFLLAILLVGASAWSAQSVHAAGSDANCVPVSKGGIDGFRCTNVKEGSALYKIGVREGDVIVALDGRPTLKTPKKALRRLQKLRVSDGLRIDVNRDGKPLTLDYDIK